jgi:hypothetical protein
LESLVKTVHDHIRSFELAGRALKAIRDEEYYKKTHATFEDFCKVEFGFSASRARQLIAAADAVDVAKSVTNGSAFPTNERQARVLAGLSDEREQATVWAKAVETAEENGKPITASSIASAAKQVREPQPVQRTLDTSAWQPEEADGPAVAVADRPKEPNVLGDLKAALADDVAARLEPFGGAKHVDLFVADVLEQLAKDLRS